MPTCVALGSNDAHLLAGGVGPYHPNAAGVRAVAEAITGRLSA